MQRKTAPFDANELYNSLTGREREKVSSAIRARCKSREEDRYARLQSAEIAKNKLIQELSCVEYEIAENDNWFVAAKGGPVDVEPDLLRAHRRKAKELYSRRRALADALLPEAEEHIQKIVANIEMEEAKEPLFQSRDLERLLQPFHEARMRERQRVLATQTMESIRRREEAEERRRDEYEALLDRLRAEQQERHRIIAAERRKKRANDIRARVCARNIPYLVHFTPIENVESIIVNGLCSRNTLAGKDFVSTDDYRSDGWLDWVSTSVTFPNYKMFYAKRNSLVAVKGWAVLLINTEVLWNLDCKFILTNAASFGIRMFSDDLWSSVDAFEEMFASQKYRNGIPDCYTTDPQAEVMIRDKVPRKYIEVVALASQSAADQLNYLRDVRVEIRPRLFGGRCDFEHWRQFRLSPFLNPNTIS